MRLSPNFLLGLFATVACMLATSEASVFLPCNVKTSRSSLSSYSNRHLDLRTRHRRHQREVVTAMAIPGNGLAEQVFVGGFANFLQIYNLVITARILLSWFPQAQGVGALQPLYQITDPFLNLFRGVIPPIGGLDLSPLAAFFLLNVVTNATAAVGAEIPPHIKNKIVQQRHFGSTRMVAVGPSPMQ